ncbi:hypothetical protein [Microcella flavibacter]|uniref:hypothetical protein n=1 Tax=Microcella flavibacter TaxID=1804990 RepID=UPI0014566D37|nr:hypothetical protein [Microcella flavibacter]
MSGSARSVGSRRLALARRLLPAALRERYDEQWSADLRDADELGVPGPSIAWGALRFAALSRFGPHGAEPAELERQSWHLARWGGALIGTAAVGSTVGFLGFGGLAGLGPLAAVHPALALVGLAPVLFVVGAAAAGIALLWAAVLRRPRIHPMSLLVVLALSAGSVLIALWPVAIDRPDPLASTLLGGGALLLVLGAIGALVVWGATPAEKWRPLPRDASDRPGRSGPVTLAASLAMVGVIVLGLVEGLVWGVQDQAGGIPAAAVYAALTDLDRVYGIANVLVWAAIASVGPLVLILVRHRALVRGEAEAAVTRLVGVLGLLGVGATVFFQGWATFSIGMSIADTLPPYTGSRSTLWFAYSSVGTIAALTGLLLALAPTARTSGSAPVRAAASRDLRRAYPPLG